MCLKIETRSKSAFLQFSFMVMDHFWLSICCVICPIQAPDFLENIKSKKFILIHGEGFGAWCWYKTIALLEETGLIPIAFDLTGSGIDLTDSNAVTTLAEYSKPLIDYLQNLPEDEKVRRFMLYDMCLFFLFITWHPTWSPFQMLNAYISDIFCRLFWLVTVVEVRVSLMHWSIFHKKSQKQFSSVLPWYPMASDHLMYLQKR